MPVDIESHMAMTMGNLASQCDVARTRLQDAREIRFTAMLVALSLVPGLTTENVLELFVFTASTCIGLFWTFAIIPGRKESFDKLDRSFHEAFWANASRRNNY